MKCSVIYIPQFLPLIMRTLWYHQRQQVYMYIYIYTSEYVYIYVYVVCGDLHSIPMPLSICLVICFFFERKRLSALSLFLCTNAFVLCRYDKVGRQTSLLLLLRDCIAFISPFPDREKGTLFISPYCPFLYMGLSTTDNNSTPASPASLKGSSSQLDLPGSPNSTGNTPGKRRYVFL